MELTVYRQASKQRPGGTIVYKGEDTLPYADSKFFFVADGLGGAAAIRHKNIKPELFEKNKLIDTLFKGVYDSRDDETFVKYVTESFFELFAVKDCYTENINNIKKSGYFASRIVSAILLHEMICNDRMKPETLFEAYASLETEEQKKEAMKKLGESVAEKIKTDLRKIARNADLRYESAYTGLALLGTTLCATVFREKEDAIEAIYLTAGDSRPYVWTEQDGLCQVLEDQEREDGGMTNYIRANDGADFDICCSYFRFKKPCVLFNATDGCFDSGYFISQMAFEKLILEKAVSTDSTSAMGEALQETFLTYGRHDDSSTIAMKFFGYESFEVFQESAQRRLDQINEDYISKMPELLEHDYAAEYQESAGKLPQRMEGVKDRLESEEAVKELCLEQMKNGKYPPYQTRLSVIDERVADEERRIGRSKAHVEDIVARNYSRFADLGTHQGSWSEKYTLSRIQGIDEKHQRKSEDYVSLIEGYQNDFEETVDKLKRIIAHIYEIGVPADFSDYDDISISVVEDCSKSIETLMDFLYSVKERKQSAIRQLTQLRRDYISQNRRLASGDEEDFRAICEMVISGDIDLSTISIRILQDDYEELKQELLKIGEAEKQIEYLNTEEKGKASRECRDIYWQKNYVEVIKAAVSDPGTAISEGLREEAAEIIRELSEQTDGIKAKAELQTELFGQYDISYGRYLGGKDE